jgi:hypothetical protein
MEVVRPLRGPGNSTVSLNDSLLVGYSNCGGNCGGYGYCDSGASLAW